MAAPSTSQPAREPLVAASGVDSGAPDEESTRSFIKAELRTMCAIGWPMAVSFFCRFAMMSMDTAFVGHLHDASSGGTQAPGGPPSFALAVSLFEGSPVPPSSGALLEDAVPGGARGPQGALLADAYGAKEYLAGASLSDMATAVMTLPLMALAFGTSPLVGQALGAGRAKMAGTWAQLAVFCITVASLPFHVAFFFVGDALGALGFRPELCELAGRYARFSVLWIIPNNWYVALRFYFQALGMARPAMYVGLAFLGVNAAMNYCLVFGGPFRQWLGWPGFGFIGAALSISISRILQCAVYFLYMFVWRRHHLATWPGWNFGFLRAEHVRAFLAQTLPQVGSMFLQMAISQCVTLLVARLGSLAVAASAAATSATMPFTITFLATLSTLAAIRVGFHLGSGRPDLGRRAAWLILGLGVALMLAFALVLLPLRFELMSAITDDEEVRDLAVQILPAVMLNLLAASVVQCCTGGILASQGRTRLSTLMSLCFELPLSLGSIAVLVLCYHADVRVVYWSQAAASVLEASVVLTIVKRSDWERYAAEAQARQRRGRPASGAEAEEEQRGPQPPAAAGVAAAEPKAEPKAEEEGRSGQRHALVAAAEPKAEVEGQSGQRKAFDVA